MLHGTVCLYEGLPLIHCSSRAYSSLLSYLLSERNIAMIQKHLVDVCRIGNPSGLIHAIGDFGCIKNAPYDCKTEGDTVVYSYTENGILLRSEWKKEKNGAYIRRDTLTNTRKTEITVFSLLSLFSRKQSHVKEMSSSPFNVTIALSAI